MDGDDSLNMPIVLKLVIVGDSAVGKSTLLKTFGGGGEASFDSYNATVGIDFIIRNHKHLKLQCWDTAGQERFRSMTVSMFRNAHIVLFAYDLSNPVGTLLHLLDYYLLNEAIPSDAYRMLIATKADVPKDHPRHQELLQECQRHVHTTIVTSAKNNDNITAIFDDICQAHLDGRIHVNVAMTPILMPTRIKKDSKSCCFY